MKYKVFAGLKLINDIEYRLIVRITGIKHLRDKLKLTHREVKDYWRQTKEPIALKVCLGNPYGIVFGCVSLIDSPKLPDYKEILLDDITN